MSRAEGGGRGCRGGRGQWRAYSVEGFAGAQREEGHRRVVCPGIGVGVGRGGPGRKWELREVIIALQGGSVTPRGLCRRGEVSLKREGRQRGMEPREGLVVSGMGGRLGEEDGGSLKGEKAAPGAQEARGLSLGSVA